MQRLPRLDHSHSTLTHESLPALDRSQAPRRRVGEIITESRPGSRTPAVLVGMTATRGDRVQRLDNERTPGIQQGRYVTDQIVHRFLADQGEIGDGDIDLQLD